jgi:antitoxin ParD1/3/4
MATRTTLNVSLTPELAAFVTSRVASGRYLSASEVVREALRLLEEREHAREAALQKVRQEIAAGLAQAKRGELVDGEAVFDELHQEDETPTEKHRGDVTR